MTLAPGLHLHFDCVSGIAGDMTLGALLDLGVPVTVIEAAFDAVGLGRARLQVRRVVKHGIASTDVQIATDLPLGEFARAPTRPLLARSVEPGHAHHPYAAIRARIAAAPLEVATQTRALAIFDLLAQAEATLHGMAVEDVVLHEAGAIDAIADIVGAAAGLAYLAPTQVSCGPVAMGSGSLHCAHGTLPVPAPAALEIMRRVGGVITDGGCARELCTPTGAAILGASVTHWGPAPTGTPIAVGWGAGDLDLADRANVVRLTALRPQPAPEAQDQVWRIETNLDDMNPQWAGTALDAVFAAGALDAYLAPVTMKKSRPAFVLTVLARGQVREAVVEAILRETTAIGVRFDRVLRRELARAHVEVETMFGSVRVKIARTGEVVQNVMPEFEDCAALARATGVPVKTVTAAAIAAYWQRERV